MSDGVALATHMKLTVGSLLSTTNYLAELAEIRAVLRAMIVTTMSADPGHMQRLCNDSIAFPKSFKLLVSDAAVSGPPAGYPSAPTGSQPASLRLAIPVLKPDRTCQGLRLPVTVPVGNAPVTASGPGRPGHTTSTVPGISLDRRGMRAAFKFKLCLA